MNIQDWKLRIDGLVNGQVLSCMRGIESNKVVTKALNGAIHVQTIGDGVQTATFKILADHYERDSINYAEASGSVVSVVYRDRQFLGIIESPPDWEVQYPGEWFTASIKLLIEEEVFV